MYADDLLKPWLDCLLDDLPEVRVFDAHTHVGENDPSGFSATIEELVGSLHTIDARAAVFPLTEPGGYAEANLACAAAAARSEGALTAFARVTPQETPDELLDQALAAGARGVKLHLSSDEFSLEDPRLRGVYGVAHELGLPVIVHAGPELETVGAAALELCGRHPGIRVILAHCGLVDLGWIGPRAAEVPNLFFDTAWWTPAHLMALFALVPPGRVLLASDLPYASPLFNTVSTARCAYQAGLDGEQIASVLGRQFQRILDGQEPLELGPPPGPEPRTPGPLLEVLSSNLLCALEAMHRGDEPGTVLTVARRGCKLPDDHPDARVAGSVAALIELYDEHHDALEKRNQFTPGWDLIAAAAIVARTPAAPLP